MAWAGAEGADVACVIASGYLSNPAKEGLESFRLNRRPPFRIRHWEKPMLTQQLGFHPELMDAHAIFIEGFRTAAEIIEAQEEFFEKLWFFRSVNNRPDRWQDDDDRDLPDDIRNGMMEGRKRVVEKYGIENLGPYSQWESGYLHGHLSALRWVMGDEWNFLDT